MSKKMRHRAIHGVEVVDFKQEMMLDYLSRSQAFDPDKANMPVSLPQSGV